MKSWNGEICQPTNEAHLLLIASLFIEQKLFVCVEITHLAPSAITLSYQFLSPLLFRLSDHLDSSFRHSQNQSSALPVLIAGKREVGPQKSLTLHCAGCMIGPYVSMHIFILIDWIRTRMCISPFSQIRTFVVYTETIAASLSKTCHLQLVSRPPKHCRCVN